MGFLLTLGLIASCTADDPLAKVHTPELGSYLSAPDDAYSWTVTSETEALANISLTSLRWHGTLWKHTIVVSKPQPPAAAIKISDTAILYITGGAPNEQDLADANHLTSLTGFPTAMLFDIPNQPIEGLHEDDLIAYTFQKYLETGDATWPLLFPMTKSAIRAMDAVQAWSHGKYKRFVVMGESKRGWTAWMTAASGDKRVIAIAPAVYDNLNLPAQAPHQMKLWGHYSPMIAAYTKLGLQQAMDTPQGLKLARMVDPYSYLQNVASRILIVRGSNDPYWAPDAISLYKSHLPSNTWIYTLPNEPHVFRDKQPYYQTVASYAEAAAYGTSIPHLSAVRVGSRIKIVCSRTPSSVKLFLAMSPDADFHNSTWKLIQAWLPKGRQRSIVSPVLSKVSGQRTAVFANAEFQIRTGGRSVPITISTPVTLLD